MPHYSFGNTPKQQKRRVWIFFGVSVAVLFLLGGAFLFRQYQQGLLPHSSDNTVRQITIERGTSVKEIAAQLEAEGVIRSDWVFEWYVRITDAASALQAGTYPLQANQSIQEIVAIITNGKVSTDLVTILPGQRLDQIRTTLINYGYSEDVVDAALDPKQYREHPALVYKPPSASLEGYIFPESFQRTAQTNPQDIVRGSLDQLDQLLTPEMQASINAQGLTIHEGIIIASIIDQESGNVADKATIAQIFLSRLEKGMPLGSDVTAVYGAIRDGVSLPDDTVAAVSKALQHDSPYNTRKYAGLPPGPISNVSKTALEAVANPSDTDYLFFVAGDPDEQGNPGKTYYAHTQAEHEENIQKYCKVLCN